MTNVILSRFGTEKTVTIPTQQGFQDFLKMVRIYEPDRRWQITESWEVEAEPTIADLFAEADRITPKPIYRSAA